MILRFSYYINDRLYKFINQWHNSMLKQRIMKDMQNNKIAQGYLQKRSKYLKQWRNRWIVLTFNFLISFKTKECKQISDVIEVINILNYKSYVNTTQEMPQTAFKITSKENVMYLIANDQEEKWSWIVALQRLLDYRVSGATRYNNLTFIRTMGIKSLSDYQSGKDHITLSKQSETSQSQGSSSKDQQTIVLMKQIFKKQEQLKKQKQLMRKQKKILKKQIQQLQLIRSKNPQLNISNSRLIKPKVSFNSSFSTINQEELTSIREQDEQEMQFQEVMRRQTLKYLEKENGENISRVEDVKIQENGQSKQRPNIINPEYNFSKRSPRQAIIYCILQQFTAKSQITFGLKYFVEFISSLCSDDKLGYSHLIFSQLKKHKNTTYFLQILLQISQSYDSYTTFHIISILIKRFFQQKITMPQSCYPLLLKKVIQILFTIDNQSREQIIDLLKIIESLSKIMNISKEEQLFAKLNKFSRLSKKGEIRYLSKNIIGMVKG